MFGGTLSLCVLVLISLLIKCISAGRKSGPGLGICNATTSLILMVGTSVILTFTHFRMMYLLDYCE
jgi:hypothetical protein